MFKIEGVKHQGKATGIFIVAVDIENGADIRIFENKSDEYVISERHKIIKKCASKEEAEIAKQTVMLRNSCYIVRKTPTGLKIQRYEGIITNAPLGTIGVFRKKKLAKRFLYEQKNKVMNERNSDKAVA